MYNLKYAAQFNFNKTKLFMISQIHTEYATQFKSKITINFSILIQFSDLMFYYYERV